MFQWVISWIKNIRHKHNLQFIERKSYCWFEGAETELTWAVYDVYKCSECGKEISKPARREHPYIIQPEDFEKEGIKLR